MSSSISRFIRSKWSLLLVLVLATSLCLSLVHAQSPSVFPSPAVSPSSTPDTPSPATPTVTTPAVSVSPSTSTSTGVQPTPTANVTRPIFPTSDTCNVCSDQYDAVHNCTARIPASTNLTLINQVLPFYQCACVNGGALFDAIQICSICLRSTGQIGSFFPPAFYNVTNQDVKAMEQVCLETQNGYSVPNGSNGHWGLILNSASWGALSTLLLLFLSFGGL
ncbi:hypothetical protein BGZ46_009285 [Entomortierella lignicola]|nr:hypothetical protein BGZ46_009285 [Entomortierella lignicola]